MRIGIVLLIVTIASGAPAQTFRLENPPKTAAAKKGLSREEAEHEARLAEARRKFFAKPAADPDAGTIKDFGGYDYRKDSGTMKPGSGYKF